MPLLITNTFWNYIINEDLSFLEDCKRILTKKIYNYDTNKYEYHAYYQELPFLNYMTLRFPAGLTKYLLSKTYLPIENKNKLETTYTEEDVLKIANEIQSINPKFEIRPYQLEATLTSLNRFSSLIQSSTGSGKGQPNWLEIPTPQGFKKIGELKVGDYVFGSNGKPTKISGVFPQGKQKIYKFKFTSGKETICDENHLWTFHCYGCKSKTYSTKELLTKNIYTIDKRGVKQYKFINELPKPIEYPEKQFDIDPYLLGVIIGDGNTTNRMVLISNPEIDKQLREFIDNKIDKTKYILKIDYHTNCPRISINLINKRLKKQSFFQKIKDLKLDCKSIDKFIPKQYFYGSVQQRLELLRGLMDTDGCCYKRKKHCSVSYSTSSYQLAKDIQQLVFSLGGICRFKKSDNRKTNIGYNLLIQLKVCPFNLDRKKQNWVPFIRNERLCEISYISEDYTTCIKVEAENELYITSDYIVTHNTSILSLVCTILKDKNILILNGNNIILQQIYDRLISFGNTDVSWNPSKEPDYSKRIVLINTSTSDSRLNKQDDKYIDFLKSVNAIIWDECFSGDTEILTDKGYKRFDELTGDELFANFKADTKEIYFTKGDLIIKKPTSQCISWKTANKANVILTEKHQQLYYDVNTSKIKKDEIKNISFINKNNKIFCSGRGIGKKEHLSTADKLLIAQCVDESILQKFKDYFSLIDFSYEVAEEFIIEIIKLRRLKQSKSVYKYISTNKDNVDFVSAVASLAGYETYQQHGIDKRKNYKDWYRVFLRKRELKSLQNCKKVPYKQLDTVYCVNVPEHNIIVRNGGDYQYAFISGNCHHIQSVTAFEPIFYTDPEKLKYLIGYTASPFRNYNDPYANADDFRTIAILGEPAFKYEMKDTIQDGNIAQPYSYFIRYNNIKKDPPKQFKDNYYLQYRLNITYNQNRNKAGLEMLKFLNRNGIKTLASFSNIKPGQNMMKTLKLQGINSLFICGASTIYEWVYTQRGSLKLEKRKGSILDIKAALEGDYNLIFGSTAVDEGVDVDLFQAVVLFSAGKTPIAGLQRIGRAARKRKTGDNISFVIDFKDVGGCYIFEKQYKQRREIMEDSGIKNISNVQEFIQLIETFNR